MSKPRTAPGWAIAFTIVFPTFVTLVYFVLLASFPAAIQQTAYLIGKTLQFVFPLFIVAYVLRQRISVARPTSGGLVWGCAFGLVILVAMIALYFGVLKPAGVFRGAAEEAIRSKVTGLGVNTCNKYLALGIFYAICHSLLEEYYWRWFVFQHLRQRTKVWTAITISSLGFMAHHVILLATFLGWLSPWTYLLSICVAVGGAAWAWLYERSGSLYGPWFSHLLVDAGIFLIGYDLVADLLR